MTKFVFNKDTIIDNIDTKLEYKSGVQYSILDVDSDYCCNYCTDGLCLCEDGMYCFGVVDYPENKDLTIPNLPCVIDLLSSGDVKCTEDEFVELVRKEYPNYFMGNYYSNFDSKMSLSMILNFIAARMFMEKRCEDLVSYFVRFQLNHLDTYGYFNFLPDENYEKKE